MITEDYVSFDTAELLKEKGFPQDPHICNTAYTSKGNLSNNAKSFVHNYKLFAKCGVKPLHYSIAPTLQMAMKWLRKEYNIHIEPRYFPMPNIYRYVIIHSPNTIENIDSHPQYFNSYEEVCEAAIKYCLENLI